MADTPIRLTVMRDARSKRPLAQDDFTTWRKVADEIEDMVHTTDVAKDQLLAFNFAHLHAATPYNINENVEYHTALVIDVDGGDWPGVCTALKKRKWNSLVYASASDDPDNPARRFRVCAETSRPFDPEEVKTTRRAFAEALGLGPGQGVETAESVSHIYFIGHLKGTPKRQVWRYDKGHAVSLDDLPTPALQWKAINAEQIERVSKGDLVDVEPDERAALLLESLAQHWEPAGAAQGRRQTLRGLGGYLARKGWRDEQIAAVVCGLDTARPEYDRVRLAVEAARQARVQPDCTAGWNSLAAWHPKAATSIEKVARDPREPDGFSGVWSEWWARSFEEGGWAAEPVARGPLALARSDPKDGAADRGGSIPMLDCKRSGEVRPTTDNVDIYLRHVLDGNVRLDEMRGRVLCVNVDESIGFFTDGVWTDVHTTELVKCCERDKLYVAASTVDRAVMAYAAGRAFNPLKDWLRQLQWDGKPRVDGAAARYWGACRSDASTAVSRVWLLSFAARGLTPGCKVDTCPVLIGKQGQLKSTSLNLLAMGDDWFADSTLPLGDKEALQIIRGKWIWELAELAELSRRDLNTTKAFLSQRVDTYRASYGKHSEDVRRITCFVGTANEHDVLSDRTGNRRFLPITVGYIDLNALKRDREQLWAEAVSRVESGEPWWATAEEELALNEVREGHRVHDAWEEWIDSWLQERGEKPFAIGDLFDSVHGVPELDRERTGMVEQKRAAGILRGLGYERRKLSKGKLKGCARWIRD